MKDIEESYNIKRILTQKLATKYNLPIKTVEKIIMHQFKFVSDIINKGKFEII